MLHIITPVKDSLATTLDTIRSVMSSRLSEPFTYTIYDDFSSDETARRLDEEALAQGFQVVHLRDVTDHPSPNYLFGFFRFRANYLFGFFRFRTNYLFGFFDFDSNKKVPDKAIRGCAIALSGTLY